MVVHHEDLLETKGFTFLNFDRPTKPKLRPPKFKPGAGSEITKLISLGGTNNIVESLLHDCG